MDFLLGRNDNRKSVRTRYFHPWHGRGKDRIGESHLRLNQPGIRASAFFLEAQRTLARQVAEMAICHCAPRHGGVGAGPGERSDPRLPPPGAGEEISGFRPKKMRLPRDFTGIKSAPGASSARLSREKRGKVRGSFAKAIYRFFHTRLVYAGQATAFYGNRMADSDVRYINVGRYLCPFHAAIL